jgi:hypothetical protein
MEVNLVSLRRGTERESCGPKVGLVLGQQTLLGRVVGALVRTEERPRESVEVCRNSRNRCGETSDAGR